MYVSITELNWYIYICIPSWLSGKESVWNSRNESSIRGMRRSPGEGNGNPLQYPCLGNPMKEEPDGLQSMGSHRGRHNLATKQQQHMCVLLLLLSLSVMSDFLWPFEHMPGFPVLHYLLEYAQTHVHWVGDAIQPSHPLSPLLLLLSIFPSVRVFSSELALCIRGPKYWSFSFSISPSNEYSGLISFGIDWFDLVAVQGTLKSLLQHHSLKTSILQSLAFFMVQLSRLYMTTRKTIVLTI